MKTSKAAPATLPDSRPLSRAASSTMPPRAQLIIRTPGCDDCYDRWIDKWIDGLMGK